MIINHNIAALNTHRQMGSANSAQMNSMEKLSSGMRINSAKDDAAGLSISEKMRGQIRGLEQASSNAQDGISMMQTAEGALNETHDILQRMRELSVQASNDTNTVQDRESIQDEVKQLGEEIQRITDQTEFNTKKLLNGDLNSATTVATHATTNTLTGNLGTTVLTALKDKDGNNAGIAIGDKITASWSVGGQQYSKELTVGALSDLDALGTQIATDATVASAAAGASASFVVTSATAGTAGQINGFSIEVESSDGVRKEAASNALSNFSTSTAAQDVHADGSLDFQIGANQGQSLNIALKDMSAEALGVRDLQVTSKSQAGTAIKVLDQAIQTVSTERSKIGSVQNRMEHTINNLATSAENLTAAESRIRDVDYAEAA